MAKFSDRVKAHGDATAQVGLDTEALAAAEAKLAESEAGEHTSRARVVADIKRAGGKVVLPGGDGASVVEYTPTDDGNDFATRTVPLDPDSPDDEAPVPLPS